MVPTLEPRCMHGTYLGLSGAPQLRSTLNRSYFLGFFVLSSESLFSNQQGINVQIFLKEQMRKPPKFKVLP